MLLCPFQDEETNLGKLSDLPNVMTVTSGKAKNSNPGFESPQWQAETYFLETELMGSWSVSDKKSVGQNKVWVTC